MATFGYGTGTGPAGLGVRHTSGKRMSVPINCALANIASTQVDLAGVDLHQLLGRHQGVLRAHVESLFGAHVDLVRMGGVELVDVPVGALHALRDALED